MHVHDIRNDSGARFDGDFQALENWSMDADFFDQLEDWGFDSTAFKSTSFSVVDLIHPDDVVTQAKTDGVAYRIVERGTSDHTIDQAFKRMAIEAGATLHYKSRIDEKDADIVACGPKDTSAIALGEIFHTSHPNHIPFQLNDKLAPGAYSYLIVIDGVGLICTCLWRKQRKSERFLNETIACYQRLYPDMDMQPVKRVGGKGDFTLNGFYTVPGPASTLSVNPVVSRTSCGLWHANGGVVRVLAAEEMLGGKPYEGSPPSTASLRPDECGQSLADEQGGRPDVQAHVRAVDARSKRGGTGCDGLGSCFVQFVQALGVPRPHRSCSSEWRARRAASAAVRKPNPRPWEQSEAALEVKARWEAVRRGGGHVSFTSNAEGEARNLSDFFIIPTPVAQGMSDLYGLKLEPMPNRLVNYGDRQRHRRH